ncbi:penicillin acylase family protein [Rhizobium jaguaris]|uniref:Penicillin acylase family protein n=1 Tax=Rhizobium jaguaris TaxID=1312183 RepID=A0A387G2T9_9HYPH|nr:penicillin acylase family protein [Rhizobium jaguaris]AYG64117.1 penicillin acylase family protein [Rhizobium jaguaris]
MAAEDRLDIEVRTINLKGLNGPAEIAVDRWGVAHIRAKTLEDLFFVQGYNAARDRLWQIDLWRKRGLGLLAADFGPGFLEQDRACRLMLYRGDMDAEWAAYSPDAKLVCEAFVAGVNAFVERIEQGGENLPPEFEKLDSRPSRWKAEDVVRIRSHCLTYNAVLEIARANVLATSGATADILRSQLEPHVQPVADPNLRLSDIPLAVADLLKLAKAPVSFSPRRLAATLSQARLWNRLDVNGEVEQSTTSEGSNNWVVSPQRSATGRPIMATDPHRAQTVPSLRYMVHLSMPGLNLIGAGEPAVPGIALGHNGHSAFSLTISGADQEDIYVYETHSGDPAVYRYNDGWESMRIVEEIFEVKGCEPQTLPLRFTRHGPVIYEDPDSRKSFAIRTVWNEPGSAPYLASLSAMRAKTFSEYCEALRGWGTPSTNHLYADVSGTIGWQIAGRTPIRPNWNGLLPVPGDGRYEWSGFVALVDLPSAVDPEQGFLATANEMNLPDGGEKSKSPIGYEWGERSRAQRIHHVLNGQPQHTVYDSCRLQNDLYSMPAERFQAVLREQRFKGDTARRAAAHMLSWDCVLNAESSPAVLFENWLTKHLKPRIFQIFAQEEYSCLLQPGNIQSILSVVERPEQWIGTDAEKTRQEILEQTLAAAWRDCEACLGADPTNWQWGQMHRLSLNHAVSRAFPELSASFDIEPMQIGGSDSTIMYAAYRSHDFQTTTGPSMRMVIDVGDWDNCLFVNLPGQSGDPRCSHYRDLKETWLGGDYKPLLYSCRAIDEATELRIVLNPAE